MVGEPVNHRGRQVVVREEPAPLRALPMRGQDETAGFLAVRDEAEQPWGSLPVDRDVTPFVEKEPRRALHVLEQAVRRPRTARRAPTHHEGGHGEEAQTAQVGAGSVGRSAPRCSGAPRGP